MNHFLRALSFCLAITILTPLGESSVLAQDASIKKISKVLQNNLNKKNPQVFRTTFSNEQALRLENLYENFLERFPNAEWAIEKSKVFKDGRSAINISIKANQFKGDYLYKLESKQKIALETKKNKIIDSEILESYSILKSGIHEIPITISIPNSVLTGTKYDIDVILEKPINDMIIAGGLINLSKKEIETRNMPKIELSPLGGGGIFKSVQAPIKPGNQYWGAVIAHPEGIISITKLVRIVENKSDLSLY